MMWGVSAIQWAYTGASSFLAVLGMPAYTPPANPSDASTPPATSAGGSWPEPRPDTGASTVGYFFDCWGEWLMPWESPPKEDALNTAVQAAKWTFGSIGVGAGLAAAGLGAFGALGVTSVGSMSLGELFVAGRAIDYAAPDFTDVLN